MHIIATHAIVAAGFAALIACRLRQAPISATLSKVMHVVVNQLRSTRSTAMRAAVLLALLVSLAFSQRTQAETESGRIVLAQRILSCGELANTLYLQYTALKCNPRAVSQRDTSQHDKCKPLMDNICAIAARCERAKLFCVK
jgi:hypothetical protein